MIEKKELRGAIGRRLTQLRKTLGFDRGKMARELNIERGTYAKKERGEIVLTPEQLYVLSTERDANIDWLYTGNGSMFRSGDKPDGPEAGKSESNHPVPGASELETNTPAMLDDYRQLFTEMERLPLLRFEILAYFHRFKKENDDLF